MGAQTFLWQADGGDQILQTLVSERRQEQLVADFLDHRQVLG